MLAKIRKVSLNTEGNNPEYKVILECPDGKELFIHFDYTLVLNTYWPLEVTYNGQDKNAKLAWYTREVENMSVDGFLKIVAEKINRKYGFRVETKV